VFKHNAILGFFVRVFIAVAVILVVTVGGIYWYYEERISHEVIEEIEAFEEDRSKRISKLHHALKKGGQSLQEHFKTLDKEHNLLSIDVRFLNKNEQYRRENHALKLPIEHLMAQIPLSQRVGEYHFQIFPTPTQSIYFGFSIALLTPEEQLLQVRSLVELDPLMIQEIHEMRNFVIEIVLFTTLLLVIAIFPIVYHQYKQLRRDQQHLIESNISTLHALGNAVAKRDSDTHEHNYRVTFYSVQIAEKMGLSYHQIQGLIKGAFLHDVGKLGISDTILLKPARLDEGEFEIMKTHVLLGLDVVSGITWLEDAKSIIEHHHEKFDGSGYPHGKAGTSIPLEARIFAVADVFDALTSKRPYKEPFSVERSLAILRKETHSHFDPEVVACFEPLAAQWHEEMNSADIKTLHKRFTKTIARYFIHERLNLGWYNPVSKLIKG